MERGAGLYIGFTFKKQLGMIQLVIKDLNSEGFLLSLTNYLTHMYLLHFKLQLLLKRPGLIDICRIQTTMKKGEPINDRDEN